MSVIIGMIGSILLLVAWVFEAIESVREHRALIDLRFAFIYLAGIIAMDIYSILMNDTVFIFLNVAISVIILAEILWALWRLRG